MRRRLAIIVATIICTQICMGLFSQSVSADGEKLTPPDSVIPPDLFGMHIHSAATVSPWPTVPFKTWRLWDAYVAWPWLEPEKGKWNFKDLDKLVDLASNHGVEVLLPLGLSPAWASARPTEKSAYSPGNAAEPGDIEDWRDYVRKVGTRYKGRIHCYEIWNEPNLKEFYSGPVSEMVTLTRETYHILKDIDPTVIVVSPSATGGSGGPTWLDEFLAKGGGGYVDVVGYHFYVSPGSPEAMVSGIKKVKSVMESHKIVKPLWNTETGWLIANSQSVVKPEGSGFKSKVLSDDEAEAYIARSYILNWAMGVERLYWYAWDNHIMGLTEPDDRTVKPPALAYSAIQKWLVGARMISCGSDSDNIWTCKIVKGGGYAAWLMWSPDKTVKMYVTEDWGVQTIRDLKGGICAMDRATKVEVDPLPVLLEKPAQ
jgi:hypothetical protein